MHQLHGWVSFKKECRIMVFLRILAIHEAQNRPIFYTSFHISVNIPSFKNLKTNFLTKRGSIDVKGALIFEKWPLVAELKLKMSKSFFSHFQFQLCQQRVLFKFNFTFFICGKLFKELVLRILIGCILRGLANQAELISLRWKVTVCQAKYGEILKHFLCWENLVFLNISYAHRSNLLSDI